MITILHLADNHDVPVPARITHDPQTGTTRLIIAWPDGAERVTVTGFTLTATTTGPPLTLESGDTLTIPLPWLIGTERR